MNLFDIAVFDPLVFDTGPDLDAGLLDEEHSKRRDRRDRERLEAREDLREMVLAAFEGRPYIPRGMMEELAEVVQPFARQAEKTIEIDWEAMKASISAQFKLRLLHERYEAEQAEQDDEDAIMVLH